MKIYFGEFLVRQHCFHLSNGCMIFFVSHYYCLSPPVQRVLLLSLCLILRSLRSADHFAYVSAVILTNLSMTCHRMIGMCILSWQTWRITKKSDTTLYWINNSSKWSMCASIKILWLSVTKLIFYGQKESLLVSSELCTHLKEENSADVTYLYNHFYYRHHWSDGF
mgnify:CR=1 FL=1